MISKSIAQRVDALEERVRAQEEELQYLSQVLNRLAGAGSVGLHTGSPSASTVEDAATSLGLDASQVAQLVEATKRIFPDYRGVAVEVDPEMPEESYLVFEVHDQGSAEEIAQRRRLWYAETEAIAPNHCRTIQLSIDVKP